MKYNLFIILSAVIYLTVGNALGWEAAQKLIDLLEEFFMHQGVLNVYAPMTAVSAPTAIWGVVMIKKYTHDKSSKRIVRHDNAYARVLKSQYKKAYYDKDIERARILEACYEDFVKQTEK